MDPINYSIDVPNPMQAFTGGLQAGAGIQELQAKQQQQQLSTQQAAQLRADLADYAKAPDVKKIAALSMKYPQLSENFKRSYDMLAPQEQEAKLNTYVPMYAAALNGKPEAAADLLNNYATSLENNGDKQGAGIHKAYAQMVTDHPEQSKGIMGLLLSSAMGPDKFTSTFGGLGKESRETEAAPVDLETKRIAAKEAAIKLAGLPESQRAALLKTQAETKEIADAATDRTKRFALDKDKFVTETQLKIQENAQKYGDLPEYVNKDVNAAVGDAIAAKQSADKMFGLANAIETTIPDEIKTKGIGAKMGEFFKKIGGDQNEITRLRSEYNRIVTPAAMAAYKKVASGSTSDKDIETAMIGVPSDNASPVQMAQFLRGAAKLQQYDNVINTAKSEWLSANRGNLNRSKADTEIDGVQVPAGTSFKEFTDQFVTRKIDQMNADQKATDDLKKLNGKSYLKYGNTGGTTVSY